MSEIKIIEGGIFTDYRGQISHVNDLDMSEIARFYRGSRNSVGIAIQLSDSEEEKLFVHDSMQVSPE